MLSPEFKYPKPRRFKRLDLTNLKFKNVSSQASLSVKKSSSPKFETPTPLVPSISSPVPYSQASLVINRPNSTNASAATISNIKGFDFVLPQTTHKRCNPSLDMNIDNFLNKAQTPAKSLYNIKVTPLKHFKHEDDPEPQSTQNFMFSSRLSSQKDLTIKTFTPMSAREVQNREEDKIFSASSVLNKNSKFGICRKKPQNLMIKAPEVDDPLNRIVTSPDLAPKSSSARLINSIAKFNAFKSYDDEFIARPTLSVRLSSQDQKSNIFSSKGISKLRIAEYRNLTNGTLSTDTGYTLSDRQRALKSQSPKLKIGGKESMESTSGKQAVKCFQEIQTIVGNNLIKDMKAASIKHISNKKPSDIGLDFEVLEQIYKGGTGLLKKRS